LGSEQTFKKKERISNQKEIDSLFKDGISFSVYPLRVIYKEKKNISNERISILISVSKKRFKKAVERNRIKRLMRESYRLNKSELQKWMDTKEKYLGVAFIYMSSEIYNFITVETAIKKILITLKERLS
jgi:ribonuclease P protein component